MDPKNKNGFTLVELLVVISIIGLLATLTVANLRAFRGQARDARRLGDIRAVTGSLEACYNDSGNYPSAVMWDFIAPKYRFLYTCGPCSETLDTLFMNCPGPKKLKDPLNADVLSSYWYFYFAPDATSSIGGAPVNPACRGHYALMTTLESPKYSRPLCIDFSDANEYWTILGF